MHAEFVDAVSLPVRVAEWAAWTENTGYILNGQAADNLPPVPLALRRRITPIGRRAMEAAWTLLSTGPKTSQGVSSAPRIILVSRHGEYDRTLTLFQSLIEDGDVSPADFGLSVHHALTGLLSIATGNREGHTAISAAADPLASGLLEAVSTVIDSGKPALLLYFDQPLPPQYGGLEAVAPEDFAEATVIALLLHPGPANTRLYHTAAPMQGPAPGPAAAILLDALQTPPPAPVRLGSRILWGVTPQ